MLSKTKFVMLLAASSWYDYTVKELGGEKYLWCLTMAFVIAIIVVNREQAKQKGREAMSSGQAHIWIGYDWDEIGELIAEEIAEVLAEGGEIDLGGLKIEPFFTDEEALAGIGIELASHTVGYDIKQLDLADMLARSEALKTELTKVFKEEWGIKLEPKVFLVSDFS